MGERTEEFARARIPKLGGIVCARREDPGTVRAKRRLVDPSWWSSPRSGFALELDYDDARPWIALGSGPRALFCGRRSRGQVRPRGQLQREQHLGLQRQFRGRPDVHPAGRSRTR